MNKKPNTTKQQMKLLTKGVAEIHSEHELRDKLTKAATENKPLIIKLGLDPSAPDIHLGHTVVLRKIRQFQSFGHKAFIIIGDFTGRIGDPTGKSKGRHQLSESEVLKNADTYMAQIFKVIDKDMTVTCFNSEWLSEMSLEETMGFLSLHTVARILERDSFKNRMNEGKPIGLHELMYPLLQGIDSLKINADVELGGTDQTFNILMGRDIQNKNNKEKQVAMMMPILPGIDGVEKMSKSLGNYIGIDEPAKVMYEKVMRIPDNLIIPYFNLVTDVHPDKIDDYRIQIESGQTNPKNIKMCLAMTIVSMYHNKADALEAEANFVHVFGKGKVPKEIPTFPLGSNETVLDFLVNNQVLASKSEVRRLVKQKGIKLNDKPIDDATLFLKHDDTIRIGKKRFVKAK